MDLVVKFEIDTYTDKEGKPREYERVYVEVPLGSTVIKCEVKGADRTADKLIRGHLKEKS